MSKQTIAIHLPDGAVREVPQRHHAPRHRQLHLPAPRRRLRRGPAHAAHPGRHNATRLASPRSRQPKRPCTPPKTPPPRASSISPRPLTEDAKLELINESDPEALKVVRHSAAHVMATAVLELFPETKLGHGPATDSGFFYDFYREKPFTPDDLAAIEKKMAEVIARDEPFVREYEPREEALAEFERDGDFMKTHFVTKFTQPGAARQLLSQRQLRRLLPRPACALDRPRQGRQGHRPRRRVLARRREESRSSSASTAPPSSRKKISTPTSHASKKIAKRDHRVLGKQLDLFSIQEVAGAGLIFWHPKGAMIRKIMEDWMRDECLRRGYQLVYTPHVMRRELWKVSGHEGFYARQHVHAHGARRRRVPAQADELPRPHPHLQKLAQELPRPARSATPSSATSTATSAPAPCTACCACAALPRTTLTSSARPARSKSEVVACIDFAEAVLQHLRLPGVQGRALHLGSD